jgi:hypothetical protein
VRGEVAGFGDEVSEICVISEVSGRRDGRERGDRTNPRDRPSPILSCFRG